MYNPPNVEARCAHYGSQIVRNKSMAKDPKRLEAVVRNALGVLRNDGIFAFYLYLQYRSRKDKGGKEEGGKLTWSQVQNLWTDGEIGPLLSGNGDIRDQVIALTEDLNALLLARKVAEQTLIYALYGLRAEDKKGE